MNASPHPVIILLLCGDEVIGHGIDQILRAFLASVVGHVGLAEAVCGPIARTADFTVPWHGALAEATGSATNRTAEYLITTLMVADYLAEGLAAFGHTCQG
ncbi:MAG TPA: DUF3775 domain-containing protein [Candidatus Acidoferrales bacterium]|nr:DUF3775 domain-containing protein [Candidatus Acidoferrales bacterium]